MKTSYDILCIFFFKGLDCEWKPDFDVQNISNKKLDLDASKKHRPNTFQIATREKVFILEAKNLVDTLDEFDLMKFGDLVFFSEKLVKLGYGFEQDAKKISHSFPIFEHKFSKFSQSVLNIETMAIRAETLNPKVFPYSAESANTKLKGLSKLTWSCFGKPLDKRECLSNWANNPLRNAQLRYAAMDALVLIKIFDFIKNNCKDLNMPLR